MILNLLHAEESVRFFFPIHSDIPVMNYVLPFKLRLSGSIETKPGSHNRYCPRSWQTRNSHWNPLSLFQHFHAELPYKGIYQNVKNTSFIHTSVFTCQAWDPSAFSRVTIVAVNILELNNSRVLQQLSQKLYRFSQVLKGAVGMTLCQNERGLEFSMEIDHQNSFTDQAGKIRLTELINQSHCPCFFCGWDVLVNVHLTFYFCLILAECYKNCSFPGLIIANNSILIF